MQYTTIDLINILDQELQETWKGKRVLLSSANRLNNPVVAKAIDMTKVGKVFAYQDFRNQIHEYQKKYQVSGVVWRKSTFNQKSIECPEIHNQLIAIHGDKEKLIEAKKSVLTYWQEVTKDMTYWLASDRRFPISKEYVDRLIVQAEWAEIDAALTEIYLGLCWGNPKEYLYKWAFPQSGCYRIIAANDRPSSIKI